MTKLKAVDFPMKKLFIDLFDGDVFLVGGTIRDCLLYGDLGEDRDIDLIVTGHTYQQIENKLKKHGKTNTVGKSFAVVKFSKDGQNYDLSIPRKDIKRDKEKHSHKNFIIECGPHIPLEEDLRRRDFTCNSIAMRLKDNVLVDPFDGEKAIKQRKIIMTGPETFTDDPLRILRAARFASTHSFSVDEEIYIRAKDVPMDELSVERITEEWFRLMLESPKPSVGMTEYFKLTVLEKLFAPLYPMTLTIQDAIFHPEKDADGHHTVWFHVITALDIASKLSKMYKLDDEETLALLLAVICHDIAKPATTRWEFKRGRMTVSSMYHDSKGVPMTDEFLSALRIETRKHFPLKLTVLNMVKGHHRIYELYRNRGDVGFKAFSRLVKDMDGRDFLLVLLDFADRQSRETDPLNFSKPDEITEWYLARKEELKIDQETIKPIIYGRDLLKVGIKPGVKMGKWLKWLYEKQLDGEFDSKEEGLKLVDPINGFK